jgi:predicted NBD/HSP70 family sugar kinase
MEELSHLVGAAVEALLAATNAGDKLAAQLAKSANDRLAVALAQHPVGA